MSQPYYGDHLTDEEWQQIEPIAAGEPVGKTKVALLNVLNIFLPADNGIKWRALQ